MKLLFVVALLNLVTSVGYATALQSPSINHIESAQCCYDLSNSEKKSIDVQNAIEVLATGSQYSDFSFTSIGQKKTTKR